MMRIGIAVDHGGYLLKAPIMELINGLGFRIYDFGADKLRSDDDFPDYVIPMSRSISLNEIDRGVAICGSGVGACIAANKVRGVRAALITEIYSSHQGVEDDDMNVICIGARVVGEELAKELVERFLFSQFKREERFLRRTAKIRKVEEEKQE